MLFSSLRTAFQKNWGVLKTLFPYLWPAGMVQLKGRVVASMLLLVAAKLCNVYVPMLYKRAVDGLGTLPHGVSPDVAVGVPVVLIFSYGLARVLALGFSELRDALFAKVSARAIRQIALQTFEHLHKLSLRFHLDRRTGGMVRSLERGTDSIESLLNFLLFHIVPTLVEILLVCGILWHSFNGWFALVTFVTLVGYVAFTLLVTNWRTHYYRRMNENDTEAKSKAVDSLLNYETVKYFGNEQHEARRYEQALIAFEQASIRSKVSLSLLNVGQAFIISLGLTAIMVMAGHGVARREMSIGDFVMVNTYLLQLAIPLNFLGYIYREMRQALVNMEELFRLMTTDTEIGDAPGAAPLAVSGATIHFEQIFFGYDARRPILKGVSFTVPAGKTIAIVGPSGAGKSTISRLLFRFYEANAGQITIDGQDIRQVTQSSLRAAIAIVPQDTVLFNDTVYYNIAYGNPAASPAAIEQAAQRARIHDFIMSLPEGYQSTVGERGLKLSGGEKQRIAIARAILKNPQILLFDEATSALDSRTEQEIQLSLQEISKSRTTLVIAHRLSTVVEADEILVLEQGQVIERGTHRELLRMEGAYAAMWVRQQEAAKANSLAAIDAKEAMAGL